MNKSYLCKKIMAVSMISIVSGSCVTQSLWANENQQVVANKETASWEYAPREKSGVQWVYDKEKDQWVGEMVSLESETGDSKLEFTWKKVGLTPFTLALDIVTAPIQGFVLDPFNSKKRKREREEEEAFYCK